MTKCEENPIRDGVIGKCVNVTGFQAQEAGVLPKPVQFPADHIKCQQINCSTLSAPFPEYPLLASSRNAADQ
jgi:hypothetical protein